MILFSHLNISNGHQTNKYSKATVTASLVITQQNQYVRKTSYSKKSSPDFSIVLFIYKQLILSIVLAKFLLASLTIIVNYKRKLSCKYPCSHLLCINLYQYQSVSLFKSFCQYLLVSCLSLAYCLSIFFTIFFTICLAIFFYTS